MRNSIIVSKILFYIDKIKKYTQGMDYDIFKKNEVTIEACVFNLIQIGELANKLDNDFKNCNIQVPWKQIYGLRNRIVHDYDGVNLKLVWEIIRDDLPKLRIQLEEIK